MKTKIHIILSLLLVAANLSAQQDSTQIKRDITIEKAYQPTIQAVDKIDGTPSTMETEQPKITPEYGTYTYAVTPTHEITQLNAAKLKPNAPINAKRGFLRLGMGNHIGTLGNFGYDLISKPKDKLNFGIDHKGTFGDKMLTTNEGRFAYHHYYEAGELLAKVAYGYEAFNYYGSHPLDENALYQKGIYQFNGNEFYAENAAISSWKVSLGYKSILSDAKKSHFYAGIDYDRFAPNAGLVENQINTNAVYERKITKGKIGVNAHLQNLLYQSNKVHFAEAQKTYTVFFINPYVDFYSERWTARLGAGASFSGGGRTFAPVADVKAEVTLVDKFLYAYTKIGGDMHTNTMKEMAGINRYMNFDEKIKDTYTAFDGQLGLRIKPLYNAVIDLSASYRTIQDMYFFVNDTVRNTVGELVQSNVFAAQYHDAKVFSTNLTIDYNFNQQMGFNAGWKYNSWNLGAVYQAWQMPVHEIDFSVDMRLGRRFHTEIAAYVKTGRKALNLTDGTTRSLSSLADINWYFTYTHTSRLYAFVKLNNLINRKYEQWNGYEVNGFNVLAGVVFSF